MDGNGKADRTQVQHIKIELYRQHDRTWKMTLASPERRRAPQLTEHLNTTELDIP